MSSKTKGDKPDKNPGKLSREFMDMFSKNPEDNRRYPDSPGEKGDVVPRPNNAASPDETKPELFLSYQRDIKQTAIQLSEILREKGFTCWIDIDQTGDAGDALYALIDKDIAKSNRALKVVISCVTDKYCKSENCLREATLAESFGKSVIPLLLEPIPWPPEGPLGQKFAKLLYIDMTQGIKAKIDELVWRIKWELGERTEGAISDIKLKVLSRGIGKRWKIVGRGLGLCEGDLKEIEENKYLQSVYQSCYLVLKKWQMNKRSAANYQVLASVLSSEPVKLSDLANEYLEIFVPPHNPTPTLVPTDNVRNGQKTPDSTQTNAESIAKLISEDIKQPEEKKRGIDVGRKEAESGEGVQMADPAVKYCAIDKDETKPEVFLSYQWDIQQTVIQLSTILTERGFTCWMDIGQIGGGDKLYTKIEKGITESKVVISCMTNKYCESRNTKQEVALAIGREKTIIPLLLETIPWPPNGLLGLLFADTGYIDMRQGFEAKIDELVRSIKSHINQ